MIDLHYHSNQHYINTILIISISALLGGWYYRREQTLVRNRHLPQTIASITIQCNTIQYHTMIRHNTIAHNNIRMYNVYLPQTSDTIPQRTSNTILGFGNMQEHT